MAYSVTIKSSPSGANFYLGGKLMGRTPLMLWDLFGNYVTKFSLSGYEDYTDLVLNPNMNETTQSVTLKSTEEPPVERKASIYITSDPTGARIYGDGKDFEVTTNFTWFADPGYHEITVKLSGYEDMTTTGYFAVGYWEPATMILKKIEVPPEVPWYEKWFGWTREDLEAGVFLNPIADIFALGKVLDNLLPKEFTEALGPTPDWLYELGLWLFFAPAMATGIQGLVKAGATTAEANKVVTLLQDKGMAKALNIMKKDPLKYAKNIRQLDPAILDKMIAGMRKDQSGKILSDILQKAFDSKVTASVTIPTRLIELIKAHKLGTTIGSISLIGSIMGFDAWADWGIIDNLAFQTGKTSEDIRRDFDEGRITREEALKELDDLIELMALGEEKVRISALINPLIRIFASTWDDTAKLATDRLRTARDEIAEAEIPEVTGTLTIRPTPADAKVSVEGQIPTTGVFSAELPIGSYNWVVSKFGYTSKSGTIKLIEEGVGFSVEIIKEIVPPEELEEELTISVAPDETNIFISGHPEITKEGTYTLPLGPYTVYFSLEGYRPHTAYATLKTGKPITVSHSMIKEEEPEPEKAELLITSKPSFADVMIDGRSTFQKTPYTAFLDEGWHTIRVELSDYEPEEEDIELSWGDEKTKEFILNKVPPTKGTLRIVSDPPGAQVYIDGESKYATTPYTITLLAETYKIRLTKDGYLSDEADVVVKAGEEIKHEVELGKEPITDARITINSEPPDADIYIDGVYQYAKTPFTKLFKPATYTIRVQKEGFYPETSYIEFEEGEDSVVTFTLTEIPVPEIPPEPYIPYEPWYPTYAPPTPYVPTYIPTPPAEIPPYNYELLYPEVLAIPGVEPVSPPMDKELLINLETTDVMPTKGRIYSIAFLDLTTPGAEIQVAVLDDEATLINGFLDFFEANGYVKLVGYNVSFDYRYIFTKMMKYRRASKAWKNVKLRDIMQIMKQVKEEFVFGFNKPGTLDAWGKMLLGKGKYGSQELMLRKYMQGDFDYVKAFQNRQIELSRDLYSLARFVSSEGFISSPTPAPAPISPVPEARSEEKPGIQGKKQCPHCFADNPLSATICEICGAAI